MMQKKTETPIPNEADNGLKNLRGTIAMARTNDPNSATAQFFINTVDNAFLDFKAKNRQRLGLLRVRQGGRRGSTWWTPSRRCPRATGGPTPTYRRRP